MLVIENEFVPARSGQGCRKLNAEVAEEAEQVTAPSRSHGSRAEGVFQHQVPADDPGKYLTERCVAIGISRAGNGDGGSKFRIAQSGKHAARCGQNERKDDGWSGKLRRRGSSKNKDSRADNCANTESDQVVDAERPLEAVLASFMGFTEDEFQRFGGEQVSHAAGTSQ